MDKRYAVFVNTDMSRYTGMWVAIVGEEVVSFGENPKTVYKKAAEGHPGKRPLLAKVPTNETMIL